jgi:hypothetical protein
VNQLDDKRTAIERLRSALQDIAEDPYAVDGGAAEIARAAHERTQAMSDDLAYFGHFYRPEKDQAMTREPPRRYEIRQGQFGLYFHDLQANDDMPMTVVLDKLNRLEEYKERLARANEGRPIDDTI